MSLRSTYDWLQIQKEFVQGIRVKDAVTSEVKLKFPTHKELCEIHGCALKTIQLKSMKGSWSVMRDQFKRKLQLKNVDINSEDLLGVSVMFDGKLLNTSENILKLIDAKLEPYLALLADEDDDNPQALVNRGYEEDDDIQYLKPLTTRELKDITATMKDIQSIVRTTLGEGETENLLEDVRNSLAENNGRRRKTASRGANTIVTELEKLLEHENQRVQLEKQLAQQQAELRQLREGN